MKITQRILAVVMSILIMTILPLNAFAAKTVDTIDLTVDIEPGMMMEDYEDYVTINTPGITFNEEIHVFIVEIIEEVMYVPSSERFEPGCVYEIAIILDVAEGYVFADREDDFKSVTVNGEEVYFEEYLDEDYIETGCYAVYTTVEMDNTIAEIDITVDPATGYLIDDYYRYVHINSMGVEFEEKLDRGVKVTDAFGGDPFNYFIEEEYALEICLTPARGCEFTKDDEGNIQLESVTLNGETVEYTAHIEDNRGYFEYIIINLNITPAEKEAITIIEITIADDLKGYAVEDYEDYITIETEGVTFDSYDPYAVTAYTSLWEEIFEFSGGERYWLSMNFIAEDGYFFDPDGILIIINGEEYAYYDYYTYETENGITVESVHIEYITEFTGNFFDRIIAWFANIFDTIFGFLFGWISF